MLPGGVTRSDEDTKVEFTPSLELAKSRARNKLPRNPVTGERFDRKTEPRPSDFEFLGLGVYSYIAHLRRMQQFFVLLALLSVSSIIANGYGGQLSDQQLNVVTWLFTGSSLGNASSVAPSYGSTEFVISTVMTLFLYWALGTLEEDAHRVEQKQITPADFTVMISGLPSDGPVAPVLAAINAAGEVAGKHIPDGVVVPLHQRELILVQREVDSNAELIEAYAVDADRLTAALASGRLSKPGTKRLASLEKALAAARATDAKLMAKAKTQVAALGGAPPPCAGVAFVTFDDANDAVRLLQQEAISLPALGAARYKVKRPPEPSDLLWENLGSTDGTARQVKGTIYMALLSLAGAFLIGASSYLQPHAAEHKDADSALKQMAVVAIGTAVLLVGYLVVFITVPIVEVAFMRHTTVTSKEVSQVLKLVGFQILATLSTIGSFVGDTNGALNRDWYITGGFMLVNGMMVDLFVISCVIQGWGLNLRLGRLVFAPGSLTQMEMDRFYAGDGASMYVVDRLQMVTKFVVMCRRVLRQSAALVAPQLAHPGLLLRLRLHASWPRHAPRNEPPSRAGAEPYGRLRCVREGPAQKPANLRGVHITRRCYIASAAIPLLNWVVLLVLTISIFIDETNLLRVLYPAPQSDAAVVKCILVFVMPLAVLFHLFAARVFFAELGISSLTDALSGARLVLTDNVGSALSGATHGPESLTDALGDASEALGAGLGLGSKDADGITFVRWSFWFNMPLVVFFMAREWPKYFGWWKRAPVVHLQGLSFVGRSVGGAIGGIGGAAGRMATAAGSVLPTSQLTSALGEELTMGMDEAKSLAGNIFEGVGNTLKLTSRDSEGPNEALAVKYPHLVAIYTKAGRAAELPYAPPDTSALITKCLDRGF